LCSLTLWNTGVTGAGRSVLAALPELRALSPWGSKVTDKSAKGLVALKGLQHLHQDYLPAGDEDDQGGGRAHGAARAAGRQHEVTPEGAAALKKGLPRLDLRGK
jgi:hypothetical protein